MNLKSYTDSPEIKHAQLAEMDFRVRKEDYRFYQDLEVPCYQSDNRTALKPSSFMDMAQEIAYWAAQDLGFGYDTLHIHHTAWVLSRMHLHFVKMPLWRDVVRLYTWHKGANGLFYLRDFELKDADGEVLATATSSWVVIDERTRRFVRPEDIELTAPENGQIRGKVSSVIFKGIHYEIIVQSGRYEVMIQNVGDEKGIYLLKGSSADKSSFSASLPASSSVR